MRKINIEDVVKKLENEKNIIKLNKENDKRYFVDTGYFLINSSNILPIYLVEYNNEIYLADYGQTLEGFNVDFNELNMQTQILIKEKLKDLEVEFDGKTLLMKVVNNYEFGCLNIFVCAIMFLQGLI